MYNRYPGGGAPQRVPTPSAAGREKPRPSPLPPQRPRNNPPPKGTSPRGGQRPPPKEAGEKPKAPPPSGGAAASRRGLEQILARLDPGKLETEDLLVLAILWLLYRDSGDKDLLIAMGAYLFL